MAIDVSAMDLSEALVSLHVETLFVLAICVTFLLGLVLVAAWMQERIPALGWWGLAYLVGGTSGLLWRVGDLFSSALACDIANAMLFLGVGMIWGAARSLHGRPPLRSAQATGAAIWLVACCFPAFAAATTFRFILSAVIVAVYTVLIAAELRHERRKAMIRRWPALFVPMLHGAIFLFPVGLAALEPTGGSRGVAGWVVVFAVEVVLYVVGAAFIVLIFAKDRAVRMYKIAAATDPLTGVLNRRGFSEAASSIMASNRGSQRPICVLAFDLDRFKSINDRFGHDAGDRMLQLFASVVRKSMRADDIVGRLGGEEFVTIVVGSLADAAMVAERVRSAFAAASITVDDEVLAATVSIGVAYGTPFASLEALIARADEALYRAKANGRDRVETADQPVEPAAGADRTAASPASRVRQYGTASISRAAR